VSLRLRLSLLFLGLFILGFLSVLGRSIESARQEVAGDIESTRVLASQLVSLLFHVHEGEAAGSDPALPHFSAHLAELEAQLGFHLEFASEAPNLLQATAQEPVPVLAPGWFVSLLDIPPDSMTLQFSSDKGTDIRFTIDPGQHINKSWLVVQQTLLSRAIGLILFYLISHVIIGYWLAPISQIVPVLEEIVRGDFSRRMPRISLPEIDLVTRKINHLVAVLGASRADNERLARQSINAQEQERRYFAQELHDSLGQSVSAIKAMAVSIAMRSHGSDPVVAESALEIEKISNTAYASVRDMMAWLRPAVLDELGLKQALQHMVDEWNMHHPDTFCRLSLEGKFDDLLEEQKINVYRIVQEALTNAAKHAKAELLNITLGGQEVISLIISDNGMGFAMDKAQTGMGLRSIRDRTNMLQGTFSIISRPGQGTTLQMEFPRVTRFRRRASDRIPT